MSAAEEFADDMITRFGMPRTVEFYRSLIAYAFSNGQLHRSVQSQQALDEAFRKVDAARAAS